LNKKKENKVENNIKTAKFQITPLPHRANKIKTGNKIIARLLVEIKSPVKVTINKENKE